MDDEVRDDNALDAPEFDAGIQGDEDIDRTGAYSWDRASEAAAEVPEEFQNPPGASRGECDDEASDKVAGCDLEVTALTEDQVLEESLPGVGIDGFEGEEVGGG